jgi:hypothetical protein
MWEFRLIELTYCAWSFVDIRLNCFDDRKSDFLRAFIKYVDICGPHNCDLPGLYLTSLWPCVSLHLSFKGNRISLGFTLRGTVTKTYLDFADLKVN